MIRRILDRAIFLLYPFFERMGFHVFPVNFYSPLPDTRWIRQKLALFDKANAMVGVDLRSDKQVQILKSIVAPHEQEYRDEGRGDFGVVAERMISFAPINALTLFAFVRHFRPRLMLEVGSGMSTRIAAAAFAKNNARGGPASLSSSIPTPALK